MLPFLKNRDDGVGTGPVETQRRKPDEPSDFDTLDAVSEDLLTAVQNKDKGLLRAALTALCDYLRSEDAAQDEEMGE